MGKIDGPIDEPVDFINNHGHDIGFSSIFRSPFMGDRLRVNNEHIGSGTTLSEMRLEVPRKQCILYVKIRLIGRRGISWQRGRAFRLR